MCISMKQVEVSTQLAFTDPIAVVCIIPCCRCRIMQCFESLPMPAGRYVPRAVLMDLVSIFHLAIYLCIDLLPAP